MATQPSRAQKFLLILFSLISYAVGAGSLVLLILWYADLSPLGLLEGLPRLQFESLWSAVLWNGLWVLGFGYHHSLLARKSVKQVMQQFVPEASIRSIYMLITGLYITAMLIFWAPIEAVLWQLEGWALYSVLSLFVAGWCILFLATFMIDHFELFGLKQPFQYGRASEHSNQPLVKSGFYRYVRHPIMTGLLIGIWCVPFMDAGKLVMSLALTAYVFIGLKYEERALKAELGEAYEHYCAEVGMLLPRLFTHRSKSLEVIH